MVLYSTHRYGYILHRSNDHRHCERESKRIYRQMKTAGFTPAFLFAPAHQVRQKNIPYNGRNEQTIKEI